MKKHKLTPMASVIASAVSGSDPVLMLTGPIYVTPKVLAKAGLAMEDMDIFEVNEAFAPIPLAWAKELRADMNKAQRQRRRTGPGTSGGKLRMQALRHGGSRACAPER